MSYSLSASDDKFPQVTSTHRQSGQLFIGQDVPEDLSDQRAGDANTSSDLNLTQLLLM